MSPHAKLHDFENAEPACVRCGLRPTGASHANQTDCATELWQITGVMIPLMRQISADGCARVIGLMRSTIAELDLRRRTFDGRATSRIGRARQ